MKRLFKVLENNKVKVFGIMAIILIIIFSFSITPKHVQNDIFYTIKIGDLIRENGIDGIDHFSWHEGLPYTYPHWLYDFGMSYIYDLGGFDAIYISTCILSCILGICIYFVNSRITKNKLISFLVTIAVLYLLRGYITARAQLVTFILFILFVYNIEKFLENKKVINALAMLAIQTLIANLHVAVWPFTFILYLPYIAEYLFIELEDMILYQKLGIRHLKRKANRIQAKINKNKANDKYIKKLQIITERLLLKQENVQKIKERKDKDKGKEYKIVINKNKNVKWLMIIMLLSILTGFLTPLGKTPFNYTYLTLIGETTHNISEHIPLVLANNIPIICTLIAVFTLITFTKVKISISDLCMLGGLCFFMFWTRRQQSMFVLIGSIAFTRLLVQSFEMSMDKSAGDMVEKCINRFTAFILIVGILGWSLHLYSKIRDDNYINKKVYPIEASEWILQNLDVKNIKLYNEYNYGSYLLFKDIPVFVDSRADLYAPEFNTPTGNVKEGTDIFMDFINSSNITEYYGDIFKKYGITHAILYKNSKMSMLIRKIDSEKYNEIYSDDYFVIYEVITQ